MHSFPLFFTFTVTCRCPHKMGNQDSLAWRSRPTVLRSKSANTNHEKGWAQQIEISNSATPPLQIPQFQTWNQLTERSISVLVARAINQVSSLRTIQASSQSHVPNSTIEKQSRQFPCFVNYLWNRQAISWLGVGSRFLYINEPSWCLVCFPLWSYMHSHTDPIPRAMKAVRTTYDQASCQLFLHFSCPVPKN